MGSGKTAIITPLLILKLNREKLQRNINKIFVVMPESLIKSSYFINSKYVSPIINDIKKYKYDNIYDKNLIENDELIDSYEKLSFTNIISDNFLKYFKLYRPRNNKKYISFKNDAFIFDEIDDLLNPLTNQLNIVDCNLNKNDNYYFINIIKICVSFIKSLYENYNETSIKHLYVYFNDEEYFVFKNENKYNELFKYIIKTNYQHIISKYENIDVDNYINTIIQNNIGWIENNDELNTLSDILYNLYTNSISVFKLSKNVNYGLSKKKFTNFREIDTKYYLALPYNAVDTPVYGSEFSNLYQKILFTLNSYLTKSTNINDVIKNIRKYDL